MKAENFCYWLQGYFEINAKQQKGNGLNFEQVQTIQDHLNLVFFHDIDPKQGNQEHQKQLNAIHNGANGAPILFRC